MLNKPSRETAYQQQNFFVHYVYHMTHIENLETIIQHGLMGHGNPYQARDISNKEVNERRSHREPVYKKPVHDYVPFYFNPRNAMMYSRQNEPLVLLALKGSVIGRRGVIFTDRNASTNSANYYRGFDQLNRLPMQKIYSKSWAEDRISDDVLMKTMMAEVLVPRTVDFNEFSKIICPNETMRSRVLNILDTMGYLAIDVIVDGKKFFA